MPIQQAYNPNQLQFLDIVKLFRCGECPVGFTGDGENCDGKCGHLVLLTLVSGAFVPNTFSEAAFRIINSEGHTTLNLLPTYNY